MAPFDIVCHAVGHHDNKRLDLSCSDKIVHDESDMPLPPPCCLILTPSVLEIEHGVTLVVFAIRWRCIDKGSLLHLSAGRVEDHLLDIAVRHILQCKEVCVRSWYLNTALPTTGAIEVVGAGIVDHRTINDHVVIMEPFVHWAGCRTSPHSFCVFGQFGAATAT